MSGWNDWALAVALTVGLVVGAGTARAGESGSVTYAGASPVRACSEAAAAAATAGTRSRAGLAACDEAIKSPLLMTVSQRASVYLDRGVLLLAAAKYDDAIADDGAAIELQADLTEAYMDRGAAYMAKRRFADAVADYTHALSLAPKEPAGVYFDRGLAREELGDLKGAYFDYLQAARLNPTWDRPKAELARFSVAGPAQG